MLHKALEDRVRVHIYTIDLTYSPNLLFGGGLSQRCTIQDASMKAAAARFEQEKAEEVRHYELV